MKNIFTLNIIGVVLLITVLNCGFTLVDFNGGVTSNKKSGTAKVNSCISSSQQRGSNGFAIGWTNSVPDGPGTCSSGGGCHYGSSVIPGINFTSSPVFSGIGNNTYVPGTTYEIYLHVSGFPRWGYDCEMLDGQLPTSQLAGSVSPVYNSLMHSAAVYPSSITHSQPIASTDFAHWRWTAPANGNVYIYLDCLGCGGPTTESGDNAALFTKVLTPALSSGITSNLDKQFNFKLFPTPTIDNFHLSYKLNKRCSVSINIFDINGKLVSDVLNETKDAGEQSLNVNIENLNKGIYVVNLNIEGQNTIKKLIIQ